MQTYEGDRLVDSTQGSYKELLERVEKLNEAGATHHVMGLFPKPGEEITINGLVFKVRKTNLKTGKILLKIKKPE